MAFSSEKTIGGNLVPVGGESGPQNGPVVAMPCWPGFPLKKFSVLQREALDGQDSPLWWPKFPSCSIYIYAVKLLSGPSLGVFGSYYLVQVGFLKLLSGPSLCF